MPHRACTPRADTQSRPSSFSAIALAACLWVSGCGGANDPATAGAQALDRGDYAAAAIHYKTAVQAQPGSSELRLRLADALERTNDTSGAEQQLRQALERQADENVVVPRLALVMLDRNDLDRLVREFGSRRLRDPQADSTLRGAVALALLGRKQVVPARAALDGVADSPAVTLARAQLLVVEGQSKQALALLAPLKDAPATPWWVLRASARLALGAGEVDSGVDLLRKAHAQVPWQRSVAGEYGEALVGANRVAEAAAVRDQLRKQAPRHFWTHYLDALLHTRAGRSEEAHAAALRVLAVAPDHTPSVLLAAAAELRKGDLLMADKRLSALAQRQPDLLPVLRLQAQTQLRMGRTVEAAATVRRGLVIAPNDAQLLGEKADAEIAAGQMPQAAATLAELATLRPQDAEPLLRLAEVRHAAGDKAAARPLLERAGALAKGNAAQQSRIVAAALRFQETPLARRIADAAVATQPDDPQARLTLAAVQSAQNDGAGAWSTTLAVLDRSPAQAGALTALSAMSRTPEQRRELARRYAAAVDAHAPDAQVYLDDAALLRFEPAAGLTPLDVLQKGIAAVPAAVGLRAALVDELLRAGETDKGLAAAQAGATMTGASAEAVELLASVYERLGKTPQALDTYRKLAADYPQRVDWRIKLAQYEAAQRPTEAAGILRALITERPFDPTPYLALARLTSRTNLDGALSVARQMGQRPEFRGAALLLEGELMAQAGRTDDALVQFSKADKAGAVPQAMLRTVRLLDQAGRGPAAEQQLGDAMRRFPADPQVVALAAQRAQAAGDAARAVALLQALVDKAPGNPVLRNDLAWAQIAAGKPAAALENARRATAALPNNAIAMHTLGLALAQTGRRDDAIAALQTAANLAPTAALPRFHLAQQLLAAGNRPAALNALRGADVTQLGAQDRAAADKLRAELTGS